MMTGWLSLHAQPGNSTSPRTRENYLQQSKANKTAGIVFLGGGAALTVAGIISSNNSTSNDIIDVGPLVLTLVGIGGMLVSIPFFIISGNQSAKAAKMSAGIKWERGMPPLHPKISGNPYPSVALRWRLP